MRTPPLVVVPALLLAPALALAFTWAPRRDINIGFPGTGLHAGGTIAGRIYIAGGGYIGTALQGSFQAAAVYDPVLDTWTTRTPMSQFRTGPAAAVATFQGQERLYVLGGLDTNDFTNIIYHHDIEEFDPPANAWRVVGGASWPFGDYVWGGCAQVVDNRIIVIGGADLIDTTATVAAYDPDSDTFTALAPLPAAASDGTCALVGRTIYYFGGYRGGWASGLTDEVLAYDVDLDVWSPVANPMPFPRANAAAIAIDGVVYVIGGWDGTGFYSGMFNTTDAFDTVTGQWTEAVPDPLGCAPDDGATFKGRAGLTLHLASDGTAERLFAVGGNIGISIPTRCNESSPRPTSDVDPPTFAGLAGAIELSSCAVPPVPAVRLDWLAGSDPTGPVVYNVYRGTSPTFIPDLTNRIATRVAATTYDDTLTAAACFNSFWYVVRAEDSASPPNEDPNTVRLQVDVLCAQPPAPTAIGNLLRGVKDTNRDPLLDWSGYVPGPGVNHYHVHRTVSPLGLPGNVVAEPATPTYTDLAASGAFYLYQVGSANACEVESSE